MIDDLREIGHDLFEAGEIVGIGIVFLLSVLLVVAIAVTIYSAFNAIPIP